MVLTLVAGNATLSWFQRGNQTILAQAEKLGMASAEQPLGDIAAVWHTIAALLHPKDLCSCIQACKQLRQLSDVQVVWKSIAFGTWQKLADPDRGGYSSYKALVLDDNRQNVVLAMPLPGVSCDWRYQRPSIFYYKCRLLELQWWRSNNTLRLYFDARGEVDLRSPITSSLAVVTLRAHQQLHMQAPSAVQAAGFSSPSPSSSCGAVVTSVQSSSPPFHMQQQQQSGAAAAADPNCWSEKVAVFPPDECQLLTNRRGHYKGVLIWSTYQCSQILDLLMQSEHQQPRIEQQQQLLQPQPQHVHQQRGRRSEAFEEWADWELQRQQDSEQGTAGASSGHWTRAGSSSSRHGVGSRTVSDSSSTRQDGWRDSVGRLLGGMCHRRPGDSSRGAAAADAATMMTTLECSEAAAAAQVPPPPRALVFCYANNLDRYFNRLESTHYGLPDYTLAPLMVVQPDIEASAAHVVADHCHGGVTVQPAAAPQELGALLPACPARPSPAAAAAQDGASIHTTYPSVALAGGHTAAPVDTSDHQAGADDGDHMTDNNLLGLPGLQVAGNDDVEEEEEDEEENFLFVADMGPGVGPPVHALDAGFPGLLFPHTPGPAPYNMRRVNHLGTQWAPPGIAAAREGRWAAEWCRLPGARFAARGQLYEQLQHESAVAEGARWADLPEPVKRRGRAWWV